MLSKTPLLTKSKSIYAKLPPGPVKIPFIGNLHILVASSHPPHRILRDLAVKYGPLIHLQLGEIPTAVVSSPELAKQLFKTHDANFSDRPCLTVAKLLGLDKGIAFRPYGEYWRQLRKIMSTEFMSMKRLQYFRSIREEEFNDLCKLIASKEGHVINLTEIVDSTMHDVTTHACLGKKTGEAAAFVSLVREGVEMSCGFQMEDLYPSIKLMSCLNGRLRRRIEEMDRERERLLEKIICDHQTRATDRISVANDEGIKNEDFIDVLLKYHDDPTQELVLATDEFKQILMDIFGASETIATVVDWSMSELIKHQRDLKKAQDEIRHVYNERGFVDESSLHKLKYLKLVIKETLRLHSPLPLLLPRENKQLCEINGYELPANTRLLVNVWAMGRDPKYWGEDAESFVPERFNHDDYFHIDLKGYNFEYLPFGAGRRICPGMSFAHANIELLLAMLMYHFDWVLPCGLNPKELDMTETLGVVIRRKDPLCVIPVVRKPIFQCG